MNVIQNFMNAVQKLGSQSSEDVRADSYRALLCQLIEGVLSDQGWKQCSFNEHDVALTLVIHCIDTRPQMFSRSHHEEHYHGQHLHAPADTDEQRKCQAMCSWIAGKFASLLAKAEAATLHSKCHEAVIKLLRVLKLRDTSSFTALAKEHILLLSDLAAGSDMEESATVKCSLRHFCFGNITVNCAVDVISEPLTTSYELKYMPAVVEGHDSMCFLQQNITRIISSIMQPACQFLDSVTLHRLWGAVCCQLDHNDTQLNAVSVDAAHEIIECQGLPKTMHTCLCLFDRLTTLLLHPKAGHMEAVGMSSAKSIFPDACQSLESALCHLMACPHFRHAVAVLPVGWGVSLKLTGALVDIIANGRCLSKLPAAALDLLISFVMPGELSEAATGTSFEKVLADDTIFSLVTNRLVNSLNSALIASYLCKSSIADVDAYCNRVKSRNVSRQSQQLPRFNDDVGQPVLVKQLVTWLASFDVSCMPSEKELVSELESLVLVLEVMCSLMSACLGQLHVNSVLNEAGALHDWLPSNLATQVLTFAKAAFKRAVDSQLSHAVKLMAQLTQAAIFLEEQAVGITHEMLVELIGYVSLPWIASDSRLLDLTLDSIVVEVQKALSPLPSSSINVAAQQTCIGALAAFAPSIAPQWRMHVLTTLAGCANASLRATLATSLPVFVHRLGSSSAVIMHTLMEASMTLASCNDFWLSSTVAASVGLLACCSAATVQLRARTATPRQSTCRGGTKPTGLAQFVAREDEQSTQSRSLESSQKLLACSEEEQGSSDSCSLICLRCGVCDQSSKEPAKIVPAHSFAVDQYKPYLKLAELHNKDTKLKLFSSIARILSHSRAAIGAARATDSSSDMKGEPASFINVLLNSLMPLLMDPAGDVRWGVSHLLCMLVGRGNSDTANQLLVRQLRQLYDSADATVKVTILSTMGKLGARSNIRDMEEFALAGLLDGLLSSASVKGPQAMIAAAAYTELRRMAAAQRLKPRNFFLQHLSSISKNVVELLQRETAKLPLSEASAFVPKMLGEIARVFEFGDTKSLLDVMESYLIPPLVFSASSVADAIIRAVAAEAGTTRKKLLVNQVQYVFCYVVQRWLPPERSTTSSKAGGALEELLIDKLGYIEREAEIDRSSLLRLRFQKIHNELLLRLSTHYKQVLRGIAYLVPYDDKAQFTDNRFTSEQLAMYLESRLLGVLTHFDSLLLTAYVPMEEKHVALSSLVSIMQFMGPRRITAVRMKVMTTLKLGLQFKTDAFNELSCRAWSCFVRSVEPAALGPMLPQVVVTLMPLLKSQPTQVAAIIKYLIVDCRDQLRDYFTELHFLPETQELADLNTTLRNYQSFVSDNNLTTMLERSLKSVQHENADVRAHALAYMKRLLRQNPDRLYNLVIGSETADPIISQTVQVLLTGCSRSTDAAARSAFGECLGEIGAIDPGRLEFQPNSLRKDVAKFLSGIKEENFAIDLINELVQAFLSAENTHVQDCVALAIQEALATYGIKKSADCKLWNRFPEEVREIATPYLDSKYILNNSTNWSNLPTPVYLSNKGATFKDWVCHWSIYLSYKVQDPDASRVFKFCMAAMSCRDLSLALYLLPHIVVHVLLGGNSGDSMKVQEEMMVVLKHAETSVQPTEFCHMSVQTVFSVLDHLRRWRTHRLPSDKKPDDPATVDISKIDNFLDSIPKDLLSRVSLNCGIYTRALLHMEQYMLASKQSIHDHLDFLLHVYARLDEPDAVAGVNAVRRHQANLSQQILTHECTGQLREAAACYERAIQASSHELKLHVGLIRCLSGLSQWSTALTHVTGLIADEPTWAKELNSHRVEAAWKLGDWQRLETFLQLDIEVPTSAWDIGLGKLLLSAKRKDPAAFAEQVQCLRSEQMGPLSAASMESGSFQRGYDSIVRLHMLTEAEHACNFLIFRDECLTTNELLSFMSHWESRLSLAQESFRVVEPILTLRRTLLNLMLSFGPRQLAEAGKGSLSQSAVESLVRQQIGHCWLQSARVACRANQMQTAYSFLLNAHPYNLPETFVEQATWLWQKGDRDQAQTCLEKGIKEFYIKAPTALTTSAKATAATSVISGAARLQHAKALLLFARYNEENSSVDSNSVFQQYRDVIEVCPNWEDGYFYLAKYYDKIMLSVAGGDKPSQQGQIMAYSVQNFGASLQYGSRYIYQSLPRALSLWLDFGASVQQNEMAATGAASASLDEKRRAALVASLTSQRGILMQLNRSVATMAEKLSAYQWLTALPQLVSRICHAHPGVSEHLQDIIAKLIVAFPQQTMWNMMAVSKSSYPIRVQRCQSIFEKAKCNRPDLKSFFHDATKLCDRLLDLCNKAVEAGTPVLSLSHDFRLLKRLTDDPNFRKILLPLQSAMTVMLPTSDLQETTAEHNPFPGKQVYLQGFDETIEVLSSLQRPKKVTMLGSNGIFYPFLCKPKDDLRKDARLMDFNSVVSKLLRRDVESRRRELRIRTYMVTPLNEECGLLEWVPNTTSYRHIMIKLYREKGCYVSLRQAQSVYNFDKNAPANTRRPAFLALRERHPPVFGEWFLRTFPDPTSWYAARVSYAHTLAVMSIVGYILGLGDRHGENVLFDSTNGDVVHVDFNCLFNKGETFDWPEVVPFRLTANMVEAMGPLGYEGIFLRACEVTLRVMREEIDPLMSVLKPFIFDPLVEWSKPLRRGAGSAAGGSAAGDSGEINNEKAVVHVQNIEDRLKGVLKSKVKATQHGLPLSIEGQVKRLIQEATSEENLCLMYFGWAAYM